MALEIRARFEVSVQRKVEGLMGYAFVGTLGMDGGVSPTLIPSGLGASLVFVFGMMCGAMKILSNLPCRSFIQ